jgi:RNA recognition motif-containing protein
MHAKPTFFPSLKQYQIQKMAALRPDAPSFQPPTGQNNNNNPLASNKPQQNQQQQKKPKQQQQSVNDPQVSDVTTEAKLFVGQIPYECDEQRLRELFEAYGTVKQIHILADAASTGGDPRSARKNPNGKGRAAFITYDNTLEADTAVFTLHNRYRMLTNRPLQVSYAKNSPNISVFGKQAAIEVAKENPSNPMPV